MARVAVSHETYSLLEQAARQRGMTPVALLEELAAQLPDPSPNLDDDSDVAEEPPD